jgi:hypothetical protein
VSGVTVSRVKTEVGGGDLSVDIAEECYRGLAREYYVTPSYGGVIYIEYNRARL